MKEIAHALIKAQLAGRHHHLVARCAPKDAGFVSDARY